MSTILARVCRVLIALGLFIGVSNPIPTGAQGGYQIIVEQIETTKYPTLGVYLDVRMPDGGFFSELDRQQVSVIEDGISRPIEHLELLRKGIQFVLAVNPGPSFAIRDAQGVSRYDYLLQSWLAWAENQSGATIDDLSFLPVGGRGKPHLKDSDRWAAVVRSYQPVERGSASWLDVLAEAVELAADPSETSMSRVVLFVTAPPDPAESPGIENLIARASQANVRIYIWMVASTELFNSPSAALLGDIAGSTGGLLFSFSGTEPIPDLENYFAPLRNSYYLTYRSQISASGTHQLSVEIKLDEGSYPSPIKEFAIEVLPPAVMFISPPTRIIRTLPSEEERRVENLMPQDQSLKVMVEFPDGHPRELVKTILYVDGLEAEVRTSPPFEEFNWDLSQLVVSGEHLLIAEATDAIGLVGKSAAIPVIVTIEIPPQSLMSIVSQNRVLFALLAVVVAGAVLLLVLVMGGRLRPGAFRKKSQRKIQTDPVTQPVIVKDEAAPKLKPGWRERLGLPRRRQPTPEPYALLIPLTEGGEEASSPPIPLRSDNIFLGSDSTHVDCVLDDPSVDPVHTLLQRKRDGEIRILDQGSLAGTWVNYTPVSQEGVCLENGDLVHIGRLGYRFVLRHPARIRKPVVRLQEPDV